MTRETISKGPRGRRPQRSPIGTGNRLSVKGKDPDYVYRIVNDAHDRVSDYQANGWELVKQSEAKIGDRRVDAPSPEGSAAQVSVGGGQKAYLMRIPKEWHEEDQAAKESRLRELEGTMKQKAQQEYGDIKGAKFEFSRD